MFYNEDSQHANTNTTQFIDYTVYTLMYIFPVFKSLKPTKHCKIMQLCLFNTYNLHSVPDREKSLLNRKTLPLGKKCEEIVSFT